jgi:hypothetical protein
VEQGTMADKPRGRPPGKAPAPSPKGREPGHLGVDDRGNVTWQWRDDDDLLADSTLGAVERVRALVDPRLEIQEDDDDPSRPIKNNPKGLKRGYNPYDSGALGKQAWKKKKSLKELSKWIELRKKAEKKSDG